MAESAEELELLIEDYLDGRMTAVERDRFEARMQRDPALRNKVLSATHSVELVQQALGWVTPGEEFDSKISSQIVVLTQSGHSFQPVAAAQPGLLTQADPDAKLLADPEAAREKKRLVLLCVAAAILFAIAAAVVVYALRSADDSPSPNAPALETSK